MHKYLCMYLVSMHEKEKIIIFLKYIGGNPYQHNHGISSPSVEHTDYSALKVEKLRQNIPKLYFFSIF